MIIIIIDSKYEEPSGSSISSENEEPSETDGSRESGSDGSDDSFIGQSSGPSPSSKRGRRAKRKELYLRGESRRAHHYSKELESSFEDANSPGASNPATASHLEPSEWNAKVCKSCAPILSKYSETFKGMKRQVTELKRRKCINPHQSDLKPSNIEIL